MRPETNRDEAETVSPCLDRQSGESRDQPRRGPLGPSRCLARCTAFQHGREFPETLGFPEWHVMLRGSFPVPAACGGRGAPAFGSFQNFWNRESKPGVSAHPRNPRNPENGRQH